MIVEILSQAESKLLDAVAMATGVRNIGLIAPKRSIDRPGIP
jgi:hypothetical protein